MKDKVKKHSRFQFRTRTLLIVATLVGTFLGLDSFVTSRAQRLLDQADKNDAELLNELSLLSPREFNSDFLSDEKRTIYEAELAAASWLDQVFLRRQVKIKYSLFQRTNEKSTRNFYYECDFQLLLFGKTTSCSKVSHSYTLD